MALIDSAPSRTFDPLQSVLAHLPHGMYGGYEVLCNVLFMDPTVPMHVKEGLRFVRDRPVLLGVIGLDMFAVIFAGAQALLPRIARRPELVSAFAREQLAEGARTSEKSYTEALRERDRLIASFTDWAAPFDAILTPPATGEAPAPDTTGDARFCSRWSLLGAPAITIPTGLGPDRLPLGLQLVASPFDDARLLAAAAWAESVLPSPGPPPL